uniref:Uncharacterized protein n=1 Tax=Ditylenchus dipsaci TaxID=166011 RepID=A0A915E096_9BILA
MFGITKISSWSILSKSVICLEMCEICGPEEVDRDWLWKLWKFGNSAPNFTLEGHEKKLKGFLSFGLGPVWCVNALKGSHKVAIGLNVGSTIITLGKEGVAFYQADLKSIESTSLKSPPVKPRSYEYQKNDDAEGDPMISIVREAEPQTPEGYVPMSKAIQPVKKKDDEQNTGQALMADAVKIEEKIKKAKEALDILRLHFAEDEDPMVMDVLKNLNAIIDQREQMLSE